MQAPLVPMLVRVKWLAVGMVRVRGIRGYWVQFHLVVKRLLLQMQNGHTQCMQLMLMVMVTWMCLALQWTTIKFCGMKIQMDKVHLVPKKL